MSISTDCRDRARECLDLARADAPEKALWLRWAMHWRRLAEFAERGAAVPLPDIVQGFGIIEPRPERSPLVTPGG